MRTFVFTAGEIEHQGDIDAALDLVRKAGGRNPYAVPNTFDESAESCDIAFEAASRDDAEYILAAYDTLGGIR